MGQVNAPALQTPMAYDPTTHLWLPIQAMPLQTDPTTGEEYAPLAVGVTNANPNGQTTMSASAPVTIASNQSPVPVQGNAAAGGAVPANPVYMGMNAFNNILRPLTSGLAKDSLNTDTILAMIPFVLTSPSIFTADMLRHPSIFKTATATAAGNTAVWTPAAGLKFRLMRYRIEVTANAAAAAAGVITISLQDAAVATSFSHSVFIPATAATTMGQGYVSPWVDVGNGFLSAVANNVLNVNLSAALTAGTVRVMASGTEE